MKATDRDRMNRVNPDFARQVHEECEAIGRANEQDAYHDFASLFGLDYRVHHEVIDAALTYNMIEDAKAGRPFASVAVVQGGGNGIPGQGFFLAAWELGRDIGNDAFAYVQAEWQAFRDQCLGRSDAA